ncbi:MAG: hypothetical protein ACOYL5_03500 [Phototrophicaceae bacterium]
MPTFVEMEYLVEDLLTVFDVQTPPIPVESMLQRPREGMWEEMDITQISGNFISVKDIYSPRMSLSRLLARHVASSRWGYARGLYELLSDVEAIHTFGRMLVMPRQMVMSLAAGARTPTAMSVHFEVPEDDARQRLQDIADNPL